MPAAQGRPPTPANAARLNLDAQCLEPGVQSRGEGASCSGPSARRSRRPRLAQVNRGCILSGSIPANIEIGAANGSVSASAPVTGAEARPRRCQSGSVVPGT